jgi:hypothetical protein
MRALAYMSYSYRYYRTNASIAETLRAVKWDIDQSVRSVRGDNRSGQFARG